MKLVVALTALMAMMGDVDGFVGTTSVAHQRCQGTIARHMAGEDPQAMTEFLAKSHEEKIRAINEVETKKNAEIEALKSEIEELKKQDSASSSSAITHAAVEGSREELAAKLIAYQNFMAKYIVEAQEQKLKAVKAAEAAMAKKYDDKLLTGGPEPAAVVPAAASKETKLYMDRNAKVSAAAAAGKSRWGDKEVERVSRTNNVGAAVIEPSKINGSTTPAPASPPATVVVDAPPEVVAADHGLRSDGSVGGLTLAERVALGAGANGAAEPAAPVLSKQSSLYQQRNAMVAASAKAGKSRWGDMEIQKAVQFASQAPAISGAAAPSTTASPEIKAADHGLRADGAVGGPSLAERVNLGAQLLGR